MLARRRPLPQRLRSASPRLRPGCWWTAPPAAQTQPPSASSGANLLAACSRVALEFGVQACWLCACSLQAFSKLGARALCKPTRALCNPWALLLQGGSGAAGGRVQAGGAAARGGGRPRGHRRRLAAGRCRAAAAGIAGGGWGLRCRQRGRCHAAGSTLQATQHSQQHHSLCSTRAARSCYIRRRSHEQLAAGCAGLQLGRRRDRRGARRCSRRLGAALRRLGAARRSRALKL